MRVAKQKGGLHVARETAIQEGKDRMKADKERKSDFGMYEVILHEAG